MIPDALLTREQVAKLLSVSTKSIQRMTAPRGPLPCVAVGARILYNPTDLRQFIDASTVRPEQERMYVPEVG